MLCRGSDGVCGRMRQIQSALLAAPVIAVVLGSAAAADPYVSNATIIANTASAKTAGSPRVQAWGLAGTGGLSFAGSPINLETDLGVIYIAGPRFTANQYAAAENVTLAHPSWRLGATLGGHAFDTPARRSGTLNYGLYGVWFPSDSVTLSVKAGAFSGHARGDYTGGAAYWYVKPDFAFFGSLDWSRYRRGFREADWTASAQLLPSHRLPLSVIAGYTRSRFNGAINLHADTAFVALRFFYNRSGKTTLVGRERTGAVGWPASFGPQGIGF